MKSASAILTLLLLGRPSGLPGEEPHRNPQFTLSVRGPCGQTIEGLPGSTFDDGTGGADFFFDPEFYRESQDEVPTNRPGHTWNIVLTTENNPAEYGSGAWGFGLGSTGPLEITDVTTTGTASCSRTSGPDCLNRNYEEVELTGPPAGGGPQTDENRGAITAIHLGGSKPIYLPPEGSEIVLKIRVAGRFPMDDGEVAIGRIVLSSRVGSRSVEISPYVLWGGGGPRITTEEGNPPLRLEDCTIRLLAVTTARFIRCDPNADGTSDIADAIWIFTELFRGGPVSPCPESLDCDADGNRDITDGIYALTHQFMGGPAPPAPYPTCDRVPGLEPADCPFGSTRCAPE